MSEQHIFVDCQAAWLPADYIKKPRRSGPERLAELQGLALDQIRYLYVGRLSREKRIDTLMRAFQRVAATTPAARLVIVGAGPQAEMLRNLAGELGIETQTDFAGSKSGDELWSEYLKASCLVMPSWSEPWGLVANEALSHGCPIVVSDRCGCVPSELAEDFGKAGTYVFRCDDIDDLVDKLTAAPAPPFRTTFATVNACPQTRSQPYTAANAATAILKGACALAGFPYDPRPNPGPVLREPAKPLEHAGLRVGVNGG